LNLPINLFFLCQEKIKNYETRISNPFVQTNIKTENKEKSEKQILNLEKIKIPEINIAENINEIKIQRSNIENLPPQIIQPTHPGIIY
jgi:hypothetical protein